MNEFQIIGNAVIGGKVVEDVAIKVEDGVIAQVSRSEFRGVKKYVFGHGKLIMPAVIDLHVHLRDWKEKGKEDVRSGTRAAIRGGVTTIVEMPNTKPPINTKKTLLKRLKLLSEKSLADFGIHFGVPPTPEELREVRDLIVGVKVYPGEILRLREIFQWASELGVKVVVHAEIVGEDEPEAVRWAVRIKPRNLNLRFAHISRLDSLEALKAAKRVDDKVFVEVTPHHTFLSKDMLVDDYLNRIGYVRPSIGEERDRRAVFEAVKNGFVDFMSSDHAPHRFREKRPKGGAPGFPGLETMLPLMVTYWMKGYIPLRTVVKLLSENPAEYLGIRKGKIKVGYYADLVVIDVKNDFIVDPSKFESKAKYSPFRGWKLRGVPVAVFRRGELMMDNGEIISAKPGVHIKKLV